MCGITGLISNKLICNATFARAHQKLDHRGKDDEGFVTIDNHGHFKHLQGPKTISKYTQKEKIEHGFSKDFLLGHHRLSIIDLSDSGHQPMTYQDIALVYNGMLYNYKSLRVHLETQGYLFTSKTDTEVILKSYHFWGEDCFSMFEGMWAIAIYNKASSELILARDQHGIKPLFYMEQNDDFFFSSEIKFLHSYSETRVLNQEIAYDFVRYCLIDHCEQTFIEGIFSVPQCSILTFRDGVKTIKKYQPKNLETSVKDFVEIFTKSVEKQFVADVPVGALISGGIDSTAIWGIAAKKLRNKIKTFSIDFSEKRFSERDYVETLNFGENYRPEFVFCDENLINKHLSSVLWHREAPLRSLSIVNQYILYNYIAKNSEIKIILTGDGGDELFLGYANDIFSILLVCVKTFNFNLFWRLSYMFCKKRQKKVFPFLWKFIREILSKKLRTSKFFRKKGFKYNRLPLGAHSYEHGSLKKNKLKSIFENPLPEYLNDTDRMSMSAGIEARVPFLDPNVVKFAKNLPLDQHFYNGLSKSPIRIISKPYVSTEVVERIDKMGFITPQEDWQTRGPLKERMEKQIKQILEDETFAFLDYPTLRCILSKHKIDGYDPYLWWRIFCLKEYINVWGLVTLEGK